MTPHLRTSMHGPSFLRWAGSKKKSLTRLSSVYRDPERHYIEPFAGSAALFFALQPKSGTLADLNGHLINALRYVRDWPKDVHKKLGRLQRDSDTYYRIRAAFNTMTPYGIDCAVMFIYLNRNCFNGLWRTNSSGNFNVPYGGTEMGDNPPFELLESCSNALNRTKLRHQDFRKTLADIGADAFVYADPPYFTAGERTFVEYGKKSFGQNDLKDLIAALVRASRQGAHIALTYNAAMTLENVPKHWSRIRFEITRNVGGFGGARKRQAEILYTNCAVESTSS
jgi:DNA adenine methylase